MTQFIRYNESSNTEIWEVDTGINIYVYFYYPSNMSWKQGSTSYPVRNLDVQAQLNRDRNSWIEKNMEFARIN